jgi:histidinol-phosphate aminotransferase
MARIISSRSKQLLRYEQSPGEIDYSLKGLVRMNLNENLVLPKRILEDACFASANKFDTRNYPSELDCGEMKRLREELARYCQCKSWKNILLGSGGDQLIDLLCQMKFRNQGGTLLTVKPSFSMYYVSALKASGNVIEVKLGKSSCEASPFKLDVAKLVRACKSTKNVKILALASPNNPTGIQYDVEQVREILDFVPASVLVVLDEAYVEYSNYSTKHLLSAYPNLVILRTFSKAFGLASQRIGYLATLNDELVREFDSFQVPFPLNSLAVFMALELLKKREVILRYARLTSRLRDNLLEDLMRLDHRLLQAIPKSKTNFILASSKKAKRIFTSLLSKHRIVVKYMPRLEPDSDFLRITVGTEEQNLHLCKALHVIARQV